jgi:hypothetical protein
MNFESFYRISCSEKCVDDGVCNNGEDCECPDCDGQKSTCVYGNVCDFGLKTCVCQVGMMRCSDNTCKPNCKDVGGNTGGKIN